MIEGLTPGIIAVFVFVTDMVTVKMAPSFTTVFLTARLDDSDAATTGATPKTPKMRAAKKRKADTFQAAPQDSPNPGILIFIPFPLKSQDPGQAAGLPKAVIRYDCRRV
jgi:hypothetical protein